MENRNTQIIDYRADFSSPANYDCNIELTQQRLDKLLDLNTEIARQNFQRLPEKDVAEAMMMKHPLSDKQAFAYFGILLGIFPPAAVFTRFFMNNGNMRAEDLWILGVVALVNLVSAVVAYFSGKIVGNIAAELERISWSKMLLALPFIGIMWGGLAGGAGGAIIFIFGAIFGAIIGASVGVFALPAFAVFHRLLKKDGKIDRRHFVPLAVGIAFTVSAFIVSM